MSSEPMTDERLAEIKQHAQQPTTFGVWKPNMPPLLKEALCSLWDERDELLAEVERLREAQIAAPISIDSRTWSAAQLLGVARIAPDGACKHNDTTIEPVGDGEGVRVCSQCGAAQYNDSSWAE